MHYSKILNLVFHMAFSSAVTEHRHLHFWNCNSDEEEEAKIMNNVISLGKKVSEFCTVGSIMQG